MAFKREKMPPPGTKKPDVVVAVGVPKPKDGDMSPGGDDMPPKPDAMGATGDPPDDESDEKMDPAKALVSHADENCGNCENYDPTTGDCEKVSGTYAPDDRCFVFYEATGDESGDAGDQAAPPPAMMAAMGGLPAGGQ